MAEPAVPVAAPVAAPEPAAPKEAPKHHLYGLRVLVTGSDGFLGQHIVEELNKVGATAFPLDRSSGYDARREAEVLQALMLSDPSVVIHTKTPAYTALSGDAFKDILDMGRNLVHGCTLTRSKLVLVESGLGIKFQDPYAAVRKMAVAYTGQAQDEDGFAFSSVRLPDLFGPGNKDLNNKIHQLAKVAILGSAMNVRNWTLPGKGGGVIEGVFVQDAAKAALAAAERGLYGFSVEPQKYASEDVFREALLACGQSGSFDWTGVAGSWDSKVTTYLGTDYLPVYRAETPLHDAIKATVEWQAVHMQEQAGKA